MEFSRRFGVKPGGGLVEQQGPGVLDNGQRNADFLPHSLGIVTDTSIENLWRKARITQGLT